MFNILKSVFGGKRSNNPEVNLPESGINSYVKGTDVSLSATQVVSLFEELISKSVDNVLYLKNNESLADQLSKEKSHYSILKEELSVAKANLDANEHTIDYGQYPQDILNANDNHSVLERDYKAKLSEISSMETPMSIINKSVRDCCKLAASEISERLRGKEGIARLTNRVKSPEDRKNFYMNYHTYFIIPAESNYVDPYNNMGDINEKSIKSFDDDSKEMLSGLYLRSAYYTEMYLLGDMDANELYELLRKIFSDSVNLSAWRVLP